MKLTMMSYTMSRRAELFDLDEMLKLTRELDLYGIDFVTLHGYEAAELRKKTDDLGIKVVCFTFLAAMGLASPEDRAVGVDLAKQGIEDAVTLGAPVIMIPTLPTAGMDRDTARGYWLEGLKEVAPMAAAAGVTLTLENFGSTESPFVTAADMMESVDQVPGCKVTYDSGGCATGEEPIQSFKDVAAHTVHAHLKDWYFSDEPREDFRPTPMLSGKYTKAALIGEGEVDNAGVVAAMREFGYDGTINIEYEGDKYHPAEAVRRAADYLRSL